MKTQKKFQIVGEIKRATVEPLTFSTPWGRAWTRGSDVMGTWKRYGFVPPSEVRNDWYFKINREGGKVEDR
jgi:hypothetical protein